MKHLTDDEIQDYLDGNISKDNIDIEKHLQTCRECRNALNQYNDLYDELKDDSDIPLPKNIAQSVVSKISVKTEVQSYNVSSDIPVGIIGITLMVIAMLYYFGLDRITNIFNYSLSFKLDFIKTFFMESLNQLTGLYETLHLLFLVGVVLIFIYAIDRIFFKPKFDSMSSEY